MSENYPSVMLAPAGWRVVTLPRAVVPEDLSAVDIEIAPLVGWDIGDGEFTPVYWGSGTKDGDCELVAVHESPYFIQHLLGPGEQLPTAAQINRRYGLS